MCDDNELAERQGGDADISSWYLEPISTGNRRYAQHPCGTRTKNWKTQTVLGILSISSVPNHTMVLFFKVPTEIGSNGSQPEFIPVNTEAGMTMVFFIGSYNKYIY